MKKIGVLSLSLLMFSLANAKTENYQEQIVIAQKAETKTLDPQKAGDGVSTKIVEMMFEPLVYMDENFDLKPGLAESWVQKDELNLTFTLKKGVKFHNGDEMKAEDVKFSLERAINTPQSSWLYDSIDKVDVIDDYTVNVKTKYSFGPLVKYLAQVSSGILNKKVVEADPDSMLNHPIGTGPYKFVKWTHGDKVEFEAFDGYYKGKPKTKYITFRSIPEANNRLIGLETGELDVAFDIATLDEAVIKNNKNLKLVSNSIPSVLYLGMDQSNPIFQNEKLKQAIAYAIDKSIIADVVYNDSAKPASSIIAEVMPAHNPNTKNYEYNVEKAKELLKEAGYPNGFETEILVNEDSTRVQISTIIQAQLKDIGIDAKINILEWGTYLSKTNEPNKSLSILSWTTPSGDADGLLYPVLHEKNLGAGGNKTYYKNKEFSGLVEKARYSLNEKERTELYHKAQEIVQTDLPAYPLLYLSGNYGAKKGVENAILKKNGFSDLGGIYIKLKD